MRRRAPFRSPEKPACRCPLSEVKRTSLIRSLTLNARTIAATAVYNGMAERTVYIAESIHEMEAARA
jgi:hypothetical protein